MHRIHYTGADVVTGSAIAHAVVEYAEALARHGTSASVVIPIRSTSDDEASAELLIGPASQIVTEPTDDGAGGELEDPELVARLERSARALTPHPTTGDDRLESSAMDEFGWPEDQA